MSWDTFRQKLASWIWSPFPSSPWEASKTWGYVPQEQQPVAPPQHPVPASVTHSEFEERIRIAYHLCAHSRSGTFALLATTAIRQPLQPVRRIQPARPISVVPVSPAIPRPPLLVPIRRDIIVIGRITPQRQPIAPMAPAPRIAPPMQVWRDVDEARPTRALDELATLASGRRKSDTLEVPAIYRKKVAAKQKESE